MYLFVFLFLIGSARFSQNEGNNDDEAVCPLQQEVKEKISHCRNQQGRVYDHCSQINRKMYKFCKDNGFQGKLFPIIQPNGEDCFCHCWLIVLKNTVDPCFGVVSKVSWIWNGLGGMYRLTNHVYPALPVPNKFGPGMTGLLSIVTAVSGFPSWACRVLNWE